MPTRCFACHKELSNPKSVSLGIGPVCRARRQRELTKQERLDREAMKCHHGFVCFNPSHVSTLLGRLRNSLDGWPNRLREEREMAGREYEQSAVAQICDRITEETSRIAESLGLNRKPVPVPKIPAADIETMMGATGQFCPANETEPGSYRVPPNLQEQYTRTKLRELKVCPFGLDCRDPHQAVRSVYVILSILTNEVDPLFRTTTYGGLVAGNEQPWWHLANILEVLGFDDEGYYIIHKDIPRLAAQAKKWAKRWWRYLDRLERKRA